MSLDDRSGTPRPLRPPGRVALSAARNAPSRRWIWVALAIVVLLSLLVALVLPGLVTGPTGGVQEMPAAQVPDAAIPTAEGRTKAEQTLQQVLKIQARLELGNAAVWGEPAWSKAAGQVAAGDRMFGERRFADAAVVYAAALDGLQQLDSEQEQIFSKALAAGQSALAANDTERARVQLELALAVKPGDELAAHSLERAQARTAVLQTMAAGASAESNSDLDAAVVAYGEALQLDGDYRPAQDSLERVTARLTDARFRAAMSRVLTAMDNGRLNDAGAALQEAALLKPGEGVVRDARQRLAQARRQSKLSRLRRNAAAMVRQEDWRGAAVQYKKALQIDANAGFARDGLAQAEARIQLNAQFDHYLNNPQRLYSAEPVTNARALLSALGKAPAGEPRLAKKIAQLKQLLAAATAPVQIRLTSDGETEVVIYRVARLGRFTERQLELRPGSYTAVGTRPGYRDVRKQFSVLPGQAPPPIDIRCQEPV